MSVSFGNPKTAWYGKTRLTKAINHGGFGVSTSLDIGKVQAAAVQTCQEFPVKKARLVRFPMKPMMMTRKGVEVIAYGMVNTNKKTGKEYVGSSSWQLALGSGADGYDYRIILAYAQLHSGKIDEVGELEYFLNELERNLQHQDPRASIKLVDQL